MKKNFVLMTMAILLSSCGYTFQGSGTVLPADIKNIHIPRVQNLSTESSLTNLMTEALRDRFDRYGVVQVVDSVGEADAVLNTKILQVKRGLRTTTGRTDTVSQLDTIVYLSSELKKVSGEVIWRAPNIQVTKAFGTVSDSIVTSSSDFAGSTIGAQDIGNLNSRELSRGQEQEALNQLSELAAKKIYDNAVAPEF